jgi:hypothetical protein
VVLPTKEYLLTVPERVVRSVVGISAGLAREVGEVAIPDGIRRSQLYQNVVDGTLRFLIEQVGEVQGVYASDTAQPDDFLVRRTAGNAVEAIGLIAFRASPVWVLAALSDVAGMGRQLIPELTTALKSEGLLDKDAEYVSVDQMLDGLEKTSSRLASSINTPPLDVAGLRREWSALREEVKGLTPDRLPSRESIRQIWTDLTAEAARQERSVFETSSIMAVSAVRAVPEGVKWLSASTVVGVTRTGQVVGTAVLDHYKDTLAEIRDVGYLPFARRQFAPYVRAAADQFSPSRITLTQKLWSKARALAPFKFWAPYKRRK